MRRRLLLRWLERFVWAGAIAAVSVLLASCDDPDPVTEVDTARGAELYQLHCVACHGGATGGHIADVPPPHNAEGHTWHHEDCLLMDIVRDGMPQREGYPEMPAFGDVLTDEDIEAILSHIKTWWEPEQRTFQAEVTEHLC
jgi:mono/diheme cytochrome c family protein